MNDQIQGSAAISSAAGAPVFVSYATADRKQALSVCKAIERRGTKCWISTRDVAPGENYQEAIVRSLRGSRAMVLVFSDAANNSDEIKKELSLASRFHVPVMALRIEDVEPSDAFAYELSTRQWLDAFNGWDRSIDALVRRLGEVSAPPFPPVTAAPQPPKTTSSRRAIFGIAAALCLLLAGAGIWWLFRPAPAAAHSMIVRLAGFKNLSPDLPAGMPDAVRDEIIAAFGDQGVVGASTASAPAPGSAPAYSFGGTIRRDGKTIRVIGHMNNERSGTTLWTYTQDFDADQASRVPRRIAVDAGNMVRCGLYGVSTYRKPVPDAVLADYMQYCQDAGISPADSSKGLDAARRVVAALPDFSWGWSAVAVAAAQNSYPRLPNSHAEDFRREGLEAADKALSLDRRNSEALATKSILIDPRDLLGQEKLLKQAVAARPLACGCEHFVYGLMLQNVGRYAESVTQFQRATNMLALDFGSQFALGDSLNVVGKPDEGRKHLQSSIELSPNPAWSDMVAILEATETGDYTAGARALRNPAIQLAGPERAALLSGFQAMAGGRAEAKTSAVRELTALPDDQKDILVTRLFAALGANHEALQAFVGGINSRSDWPSLLWYPSMRGVLSDSAFPAIAQRLGLMAYWKATHTRPDVCGTKAPPPFCRTI